MPRLQDIAPTVPSKLADIVHDALRREAYKRPTASALRDRLSRFLDGFGHRNSSLLSSLDDEIDPMAQTQPGEPAIAVKSGEIDVEFDDNPYTLSQPNPPAPEWVRTWESPLPRGVEQEVLSAERALSANMLSEAVAHANRAIQAGQGIPELYGHMCLVQAIAWYWRGEYTEAEDKAKEAEADLREGTSGWYVAFGHALMAGSALGKTGDLLSAADKMKKLQQSGLRDPFSTVASCRLMVQLLRAGRVKPAQDLLRIIDDSAVRQISGGSFLRAWRAVAHGELAAYEGDPGRYRSLTTEAEDEFVAVPDMRNAALQQGNDRSFYLMVGSYKKAERGLREALNKAEKMLLKSVSAPIRANLGFALARLGQIDEAHNEEFEALQQCDSQGDRRSVAVSKTYLAIIHSLREELTIAAQFAREADKAADGAPAVRAYALAVLADVLLRIPGRAPEARGHAKTALKLLTDLKGGEGGAALIRLVHAEALEKLGDHAAACQSIAEARDKLLARSARLSPHWRTSFEVNVPENERTLSLAQEWLGAPPRGAGPQR